MTVTVTAHDDGSALATLWFLITQAGPSAAAAGPSRQRAAALHLRYRSIRIPGTRRWGGVQLLTGLTWRVSPRKGMSDETVETAQLVALVALICTSMHPEKTTTK